MSLRLRKSRGFITGLALMMLVGISEISLTMTSSMMLGLKSYENIEKINEKLMLKTKVVRYLKEQLQNEQMIESFNIEGIAVEVYDETSGYRIKYADQIYVLAIENNEIVKIST